jgi:hypothetical protein
MKLTKRQAALAIVTLLLAQFAESSPGRRKRSKVFGIVGQMTEKQAARQLEAILARVNDPGYLPESLTTFQALAQEWSDQAFPR